MILILSSVLLGSLYASTLDVSIFRRQFVFAQETPTPTPRETLTFGDSADGTEDTPTPTAEETLTRIDQRSYCEAYEDIINSCNNTINYNYIFNNVIKNQKSTSNEVTQDGEITIHDRSGSITSTPSCSNVERIVTLNISTMDDDGVRVIAILSPCHLLDGTVLLNLPTSGIEILAANMEDEESVSAMKANKQSVADLDNGQALYSVDLDGVMLGITPKEGNPATLYDNINAIALWNNAGNDVDFNADNSLALNIISHR